MRQVDAEGDDCQESLDEQEATPIAELPSDSRLAARRAGKKLSSNAQIPEDDGDRALPCRFRSVNHPAFLKMSRWTELRTFDIAMNDSVE